MIFEREALPPRAGPAPQFTRAFHVGSAILSRRDSLVYNLSVRFTRYGVFALLFCASAPVLALLSSAQQARIPPAPAASAARILLLPQRIVAGERSTLAVLDVGGRLTPGVTVSFSNGDHVTTDATGRALFVAPLKPGVLLGSLAGRPGRIPTTILTPAEAPPDQLAVRSAPRIAALSDRFELWGSGFCGDADANRVTIGSQPALVLAASPASLVVLPPDELSPGPTSVIVACGQSGGAAFSITFVALALDASHTPLAPGERRTLAIRIRGTEERLTIEARNFAPEIAELATGTAARAASTGGPENLAKFELMGMKRGNFLVSFRLIPALAPLQR